MDSAASNDAFAPSGADPVDLAVSTSPVVAAGPARVVGVGPLPPPVHGAAAVTAAVWEAISSVADFEGIDTSSGKSSICYHVERSRRHLDALRAIVRSREQNPRVLYLTCPGGAGLWYLVGIAPVAHICGYKIIVHHHSFAYINRPSSAMRLLVSLSGTRSRHVLLCEHMAKAFGLVYRPRGGSLVCSNAAWVPSLNRHPGHIPRRFTMGFLGRLESAKGLGLVLDTLRSLLDAGVDAELRLAGPGGDGADRSLLNGAIGDLPERIIRLGSVSGLAKEEFLSSLDLFLFPTTYAHEAEPLVLLEALGAGVPVVAYARGCIGGMITSSAGLVVEQDQPFVDCVLPFLRGLAQDPDLLESYRVGAIGRFEDLASRATKGRDQLIEQLTKSDR